MRKFIISMILAFGLSCPTFAQFIETSQEMDNSIVFEGKTLKEIFKLLETNKSEASTRTVLNFLKNNTVSLKSPISNISKEKEVFVSPEGEILTEEQMAEESQRRINEITSGGLKGLMKAAKQAKDNKAYTKESRAFYFSPSFEARGVYINDASEENFEEFAKMYNANNYNGKTFAFVGVIKNDSERQLLDKEVVKYGFGYSDKFVLKDNASDFTVQLSKEQMLNAGFEVDAFKNWNEDRTENLHMTAFDFSEPYGVWLLRYWDIPRYHDQLASQEFFDYQKGKSISVDKIELFEDKTPYYKSQNERLGHFAVISSEELKALNDLYAGQYFSLVPKENMRDRVKSAEYKNIDQDKFKIEKIVMTDRSDVKSLDRSSNEYILAVVTDAGKYLPMSQFYLPKLLDLSQKSNIIKYTYFPTETLKHRYYSYSGYEENRYAPYDSLKLERDNFLKNEAKLDKEEEAERKEYEKQKEAEYQVNLKKYGNKIATAIKEGEICEGMTEEMIVKSIGLAQKTVLGTKISDGKAYDHVKYKGMLGEYEVLMNNGKVFHVINEKSLKKLVETGVFQ